MAYDRPFPQAVEAERALLGGLMQAPEQMEDVTAIVDAEAFYLPHHGKLFDLMKSMVAQAEQVDLVTVPDRVGRADAQEEYGGIGYVLELPSHAPATSNLRTYAEMVREKATLRQMIASAQQLALDAFSHAEDPSELLERATRELMTLGEGEARRSWEQVSLTIDSVIANIENLFNNGADVVGTTTGFVDLDAKLAGWHPSDLVILAARPAMGKTALALNFVKNAALVGGVAVGVFSLEMGRDQLVTRLLSTIGEVESGGLRTGKLSGEDWERLLDAAELLRSVSIHIDDTPGVTITDVRARARRLKAACPDLGLIVIDYLQLMQGDDPRASRQQQISDISRGLKILAKDLKVPVIALSQLNRAVEKREDKRPMVSDLRESGAIEQDADVIMFIYRDEIYNEDSPDKGLAEVIIAKQRNGPTGTVKLVFQGQYTRFDNLAEGDGFQWSDG